jgi:hypothetical protein
MDEWANAFGGLFHYCSSGIPVFKRVRIGGHFYRTLGTYHLGFDELFEA